jgi:hypothetical protein
MNTKIFVGGTPDEALDAYREWWDQQRGFELVEKPVILPEGAGWKVSVWYRPTSSN